MFTNENVTDELLIKALTYRLWLSQWPNDYDSPKPLRYLVSWEDLRKAEELTLEQSTAHDPWGYELTLFNPAALARRDKVAKIANTLGDVLDGLTEDETKVLAEQVVSTLENHTT